MSIKDFTSAHPTWSTRTAFILVATGSAVGLGNIWKFPYITGENGGGAFVIVYLFCIAIIGIPVMIAELMIGRRGRMSPINSMQKLASEHNSTKAWGFVGLLGFLSAFIILSFYSVVAGWSIPYIGYAFEGFSGQDAKQVGAIFGALLADPMQLVIWHSIFMFLTVMVSINGVNAGIERTIQILMPILFVLLIILILYSVFSDFNSFTKTLAYLFIPDFSKLSSNAILSALGHAFFSLSLGLGAMIAYGSYMKEDIPLAPTVCTIAFLDTLVALLAGLAIFPIVFSSGLETSTGPGLVFTTLPLAFGKIPLGEVLGVLFFVLLLVAAWSSSISMLEVMVEYLQELGMNRALSAILAGFAAWCLGITALLSFNIWSDIHILSFIPGFEKKSLFDVYDYLTANIMLPLGAFFISIFAGYIISRDDSMQDINDSVIYWLWYFLIRYVSPICILLVFFANLV